MDPPATVDVVPRPGIFVYRGREYTSASVPTVESSVSVDEESPLIQSHLTQFTISDLEKRRNKYAQTQHELDSFLDKNHSQKVEKEERLARPILIPTLSIPIQPPEPQVLSTSLSVASLASRGGDSRPRSATSVRSVDNNSNRDLKPILHQMGLETAATSTNSFERKDSLSSQHQQQRRVSTSSNSSRPPLPPTSTQRRPGSAVSSTRHSPSSISLTRHINNSSANNSSRSSSRSNLLLPASSSNSPGSSAPTSRPLSPVSIADAYGNAAVTSPIAAKDPKRSEKSPLPALSRLKSPSTPSLHTEQQVPAAPTTNFQPPHHDRSGSTGDVNLLAPSSSTVPLARKRPSSAVQRPRSAKPLSVAAPVAPAPVAVPIVSAPKPALQIPTMEVAPAAVVSHSNDSSPEKTPTPGAAPEKLEEPVAVVTRSVSFVPFVKPDRTTTPPPILIPTVRPLSAVTATTQRAAGGKGTGVLKSTLTLARIPLSTAQMDASIATTQRTSTPVIGTSSFLNTARSSGVASTRPNSAIPYPSSRPQTASSQRTATSSSLSRPGSAHYSQSGRRSEFSPSEWADSASDIILPPESVLHSAADPLIMDMHRAAKAGNCEQVERCIWLNRLRIRRMEAKMMKTGLRSTTARNLTVQPSSVDEVDPSAYLSLCDRNGSTPLFHAAWSGDMSMARLLLQYELDVNLRNVRDNSALDMAVECSRAEMVQLLLKHGARLSQVSVEKLPADQFRLQTLSERATYEIDAALKGFLLKRLTDTPHKALKLAYYVKTNNLARMSELLQTHANSTNRWIRTFMEHGLTLLGIACSMGHHEMALLLARATNGEAVEQVCFVKAHPERKGSSDDVEAIAARHARKQVKQILQEQKAEERYESDSDDDREDDSDDEKEANEEEEEDEDYDPTDIECIMARDKLLLTLETNAFALAVNNGHYRLAQSLLAEFNASPHFVPWLLPQEYHHQLEQAQHASFFNQSNNFHSVDSGSNQTSVAPGGRTGFVLTPECKEFILDRLDMLQLLRDSATELREKLVEWRDLGLHEDKALIHGYLDELRDSNSEEFVRATIQFPLAFDRCPLHVAVSLKMSVVLDILMQRGGLREVTRITTLQVDAADDDDDLDYQVSPILTQGDALRNKTLLELALETNDITCIMLLLDWSRPSLRSIIRSLDKILNPHSELSEDNGMLVLQYVFNRLRADMRLYRVRRDRALAVARLHARTRGVVFQEPDLADEDDVISLQELLAMLNETNLDEPICERILRTLLPLLHADRAERGVSSAHFPSLTDLLHKLDAHARAQGKSLTAGPGSSGYGRADSGSRRGRIPRRRKKNRLRDPRYLARLLAMQRAHAAQQHAAWLAARAALRKAEEDASEAADMKALMAMQSAMLTTKRREGLREIFLEMQYADAVDVELAKEAAKKAEKAKEEHKRKQQSHKRAMSNASLLKALPQQHATHHPVNRIHQRKRSSFDPALDLDIQLRPGKTGEVNSSPDSATVPLTAEEKALKEEKAQLRKNLPFEMQEIFEFNPRMLTALQTNSMLLVFEASPKDSPRETNSSSSPPFAPSPGLSPNSVSSFDYSRNQLQTPRTRSASQTSVSAAASESTIPPPPPAARFARHNLSSWLQAWQEQAWDEGLHSIDVFLHEYHRRKDISLPRRDWMPLLFLWPNRWSQSQAARAHHRRATRLVRLARRQHEAAMPFLRNIGVLSNVTQKRMKVRAESAQLDEREVEEAYRFSKDDPIDVSALMPKAPVNTLPPHKQQPQSHSKGRFTSTKSSVSNVAVPNITTAGSTDELLLRGFDPEAFESLRKQREELAQPFQPSIIVNSRALRLAQQAERLGQMGKQAMKEVLSKRNNPK